ncbi:MAG: hypothetical protein ACREJ5_23865 [Geminicoccaceae bacterium]
MTIEHTFAAGLVLVQAILLQPDFPTNPGDGGGREQRVSRDWRAVPGMEYEINLEDDGLVEITGHLGFQIEDKRCDRDDTFMTGIALAINGQQVRAPIGTYATQNAQRWQHYQDMPFSWVLPLERGEHVIQLMARAVAKGRAIINRCRAWFKQSHYSGMAIRVYAP